MSNKKESIKETVEQQLKALNGQITGKEKSEFIAIEGITRQTLHSYLNDSAPDIDLGIRMLEFFSPKVKARQEKLDKIVKL